MAQERIPVPLSLRERIIQNNPLESIIEGGVSHEQILTEIEDMVEDGYAYNRIISIAEVGAIHETSTPQEKLQYQKVLSYCTEVRRMNGESYDV